MADGEFSVFQFFTDDSYEQVRDHVDPKEAVEAAKHFTTSVAAQLGYVERVIITDGETSPASSGRRARVWCSRRRWHQFVEGTDHAHKIVCHFVYPPIPIRTCDWQAHYDDDDPTTTGT